VSDVLSAWEPRRGEWDRAAAAHLYRRAGFGAGASELDAALTSGYEAAVARLVEHEADDAALVGGARHLLAAGQLEPLAAWWMALMLAGTAPLRERVALLWHDHFATSHAKVGDVRLMHRQNELFRRRGLGDFRELLHAVAQDPALLVFLDGGENRRGQPNENFARELMELFALGRGAYGERDVQEAARAFTGWGTSGRSFELRADHHDAGQKTVLGTSGALGGEDVVDAILEQPACARWIAARLLAEFVAPAPEPAWVEAAAELLVREEWNVRETVRALLSSALFFSPRARRARIAAPVELVVSTAHVLGAHIAPRAAARAAEEMGQALFRPPSVKGWDGGRAWIKAGSWVARHNLLAAVAGGDAGEAELEVDASAALGAPRTAAEAAERAVHLLTPDLAGSPFAASVLEAVRAEVDGPEAAGLALGLVLTAPEYHFY
jgi:uncharacterized protein (DUF1800 family)